MIDFIRGTVSHKRPPEVVIECNQIGYAIAVSMTSFYDIPDEGEEVELLTHLIVREDAHLLYGFISEHERQLFRTLIKVNGVGPKLAITILSSIEPNMFVQSIQTNDTATLVRLPGVGKKTAERLVLDMRDRLKDWGHDNNKEGNITVAEAMPHQAKQDALSALISLGYKLNDAKRALESITDVELSSEAMIRQGLKNLTKSR